MIKILVALSFLLSPAAFSDTGDGRYTGSLTVDGSLTLNGSLISTAQVDTTDLATDAVSAAKILSDAIQTEKIKADSVTAAKLITNAVETDKIKADSVDTGKLKAINVGATDSGKAVCIRAGNGSSYGLCAGPIDGSGGCVCN